MSTFFTSDTHFGHTGCIKHCNRPFESVEEMDEILIENWNKSVKSGDLVYHLGDFAWKRLTEYRNKLNGKIILIKGNHDKQATGKRMKLFTNVFSLRTISIDKNKITLCHYPMYSWDRSVYGTWHLHGHTHNSPFKHPGLALNVGVDNWDYKPIPYEVIRDILTEMSKDKERIKDHHE